MYTIQSTRNNKFIGSLFSDGHYDTFTEREAITAYAWNSLLDCQATANDIGECKVVEIIIENTHIEDNLKILNKMLDNV